MTVISPRHVEKKEGVIIPKRAETKRIFVSLEQPQHPKP